MVDNHLCFSAEDIADITGGTWENLNDNTLIIKEFQNTYHYLKKGDCFVVRSDNWPNSSAYKNNEHLINKAVKKGISAIIVDENLKINVNIPVLKVENSYFAIKKLAKYASKNTQAKKVLITGSYGKTGFKLNLNHISKKQKSCYVRANSANYAASTYCNTASIKQDNELFLLELPVSKKEKIQRRSRLINPDIGVITSIGHEGIERFKSIEAIIENKLSIAYGIKKGGKLLLPHDDEHYLQIKKEAKKYRHVDILTYGTPRRCNANLLYKKFEDFGWNVIAKIEDRVVAYRVPFFEEYAVSTSLGVLLCAYHLGLDIHDAANEYYSCENFKSSGLFYKVNYKSKNFYLYDQSKRGGIEGYENFFKTFSYIEPKNNGRKILLTSEFVDYKDGEIAFIDTKKFQKLIKDSGIKTFYSVEKFSEHINVLSDKSIWKNHSIDFNNIKDEIIDSIKDDDILCVKGIFESILPKFILYIKNLDGIKLTKVKSKNSMQDENLSFRGLRALHVDDLATFKKYTHAADKASWIYYFPFLYFWSLSNSRELLIGEQNSSIKLFLLRTLNGEKKPDFEMFIPPLPFNETVLDNSLNALYRYNKKQKAKILWVDRDDLIKIKSSKKFDDILFKLRDREYIYNPKIYNDLSGQKLRNIRRAVAKIDTLENVEILEYSNKDKKECLELLDEWSIRQSSKYNNLDNRYTKMCLEYAHLFDKKDLLGLVFKIDSKIKSFHFAGEITKNIGSLFVIKSDHNINGLHIYMEYLMIIKMQNFNFLNAASDMGHTGLKHNKQILRPAKMLNMYKAYKDKKVTIQKEAFKDEF
ncbi:MAG: hypothetical protein A2513_08820 [Sulfurimonas sp. RIFOXYD12_FULL_33_39]|uniref:Mur ligase family protein n=1 Tax=unclassified Sulfurimonas TaxID=2623549 RepID=UPI0008AC89C3|nr:MULTISPECIES: Mur ligase family protein [unclassified Sulfurimonas]OHE10186.1 MAG: hypothetical protein A2513_08820 [Sulfurimonas sp. RIFOXYD12_FULL_33_39]OHE14593.1 MAG: hypothetical protein A2530_01660 [Sulfurimonas sp. RIFOXYD2_FULL_34_21]DAB28310.1 MAG TPA: hypothetical protein CFH78_03175 [Sulfurimonas sp. UBA10385]